MTRPIQASDGAGNLIQFLHEEALNQQHILDTWQFATALAGRHRADTHKVSRLWVGPEEQWAQPQVGTPNRIILTGGRGWPRHPAARRFLSGEGEPDDLNTRTEFTKD